MRKLSIAVAAALLLGAFSAREVFAAVSPDVAQDGAYIKSLVGQSQPGVAGVHKIEFDLPIGNGEHLHSVIQFTLQGLLNHRVLALLPGPVENLRTYDYDVPDFNAGEIVAQHGYVSVAIDPYGNVGSSKPADGTLATIEEITEKYKSAIDRLKFAFHVDSIDVYGEGGMGGLACLLLARDETRTHSCSSSGQLYIHPTQFVQENLFSPFVYFSLINADGFVFPGNPFNTVDGYLDTTAAPFIYAGATIGVDPTVAALTLQHQPSLYPTGYFLEGFKVVGLPSGTPEVVIDAKPARVPGLVINDQFDVVGEPDDNQILVSEYGATGGNNATAQLKIVEGSFSHAPRLGLDSHTRFWAYLFEFLDSLE